MTGWIDDFDDGWLETLDEFVARSTALGQRVSLLLDAAFDDGLWAILRDRADVHPLLGPIEGTPPDVLAVSPMLIAYQVLHPREVLARANGKPMVTAIATPESTPQLAARLAKWCIVNAAGTMFNFRFPDTRRLPRIAEIITPEQRTRMLGPASAWCCVGRDGRWQDLPLSQYQLALDSPVLIEALDERQFVALVDDSETDEVLAHVKAGGESLPSQLPSVRHGLAQSALQGARRQGLNAADERVAAVLEALRAA